MGLLMLELVVTIADFVFRGLCVLAVWNLIVPSELPEITFQQAVGIVLLVRILKPSKSIREYGHGRET